MFNSNVNLNGLLLKNPVISASGTCGYGLELNEHIDISFLGAVSVKGISLFRHEGNRPPRVAETPSGLLNSIGLQNVGSEIFAKKILPRLRLIKTAIIANIWGNTEEEFVNVINRLSQEDGIAAFEINISCPNISKEYREFGNNPKSTYALIKRIRKRTDRHIIVKLSPNVRDIAEIGEAAQDAGADSISAINTVMAMDIDIKKKEPVLANSIGGLSGPAIRPIALRCVWQLYKKVSIPIIGVGGIFSYQDALKFFFAGASAIQIGTAVFSNPSAPINIIDDLANWCEENNIQCLNDIIGLAHKSPK